MDRLTIHSGCKGFVCIDSIVNVEEKRIDGICMFHHDPVYLCIEALAQLGAMHVRYRTDFKKHAFLLKINHCGLPGVRFFTGACDLKGTLVSQSSRAFAYTLTATGDSGEFITGEFIFATVDYNIDFKQDVLSRHYKELFSCLQNA